MKPGTRETCGIFGLRYEAVQHKGQSDVSLEGYWERAYWRMVPALLAALERCADQPAEVVAKAAAEARENLPTLRAAATRLFAPDLDAIGKRYSIASDDPDFLALRAALRLGERPTFTDLLDIADDILAHYPPDTIVCSHDGKADIGAQTVAGIADLIASCRASLMEAV